jgi:hypothetical protein
MDRNRIAAALLPGAPMGIRVTCPNGHKLHVKSHLAGKRGLCPKCGASTPIPAAPVPAVGGSSDRASGLHRLDATASIIISIAEPTTAAFGQSSETTASVAPVGSARTTAAATAATASAEPVIVIEPGAPESPAGLYDARRARRRRKQLTVTMMLLVAVIVLAIVLFWVVRRGSGQPTIAAASLLQFSAQVETL